VEVCVLEESVAVQPKVDVVVVDDFATWTKLVSQSFVPLEVTSEHVTGFHGRIRSRLMGDVYISEITATEHQVHRTPRLIAAGDRPYFKLSLQLAGTGLLLQDGREAILSPGDIAVYDTNRPYTLTFDGDFRSLVVMFPHSLVDLPAESISQITATRIPGDEGIAKLVVPFLSHLARNMDRLSGRSGMRLMNNTIDLVATVLHAQLDAHSDDSGHSHRAALLKDVHSYIDAHLAEPGLNPGEIAAANFISTRHLHGIFKEQGVTVSAWIRARRLEHCRRDLGDPLLANKPVSSIAGRWGFVDASHFSRLFRSTFGEAPTDFRERSLAMLATASVA
jgi:AraC-like DNA-binding protein